MPETSIDSVAIVQTESGAWFMRLNGKLLWLVAYPSDRLKLE